MQEREEHCDWLHGPDSDMSYKQGLFHLLHVDPLQGKRMWLQKLPSPITCIEQMEIPSRGLNLISVALTSSHVLIFDDKNVVDCFKMDNSVSAMKFGKFGREDNTLVLVTVRHVIMSSILPDWR